MSGNNYVNFPTKLLIESIRDRPAIWNTTHPGYKNRDVVERQWNAISQITGIDERDKLKGKWKNLRDHFRNLIKKYLQNNNASSLEEIETLPPDTKIFVPQWPWFQDMLFLGDHLLVSRASMVEKLGEKGRDNSINWGEDSCIDFQEYDIKNGASFSQNTPYPLFEEFDNGDEDVKPLLTNFEITVHNEPYIQHYEPIPQLTFKSNTNIKTTEQALNQLAHTNIQVRRLSPTTPNKNANTRSSTPATLGIGPTSQIFINNGTYQNASTDYNKQNETLNIENASTSLPQITVKTVSTLNNINNDNPKKVNSEENSALKSKQRQSLLKVNKVIEIDQSENNNESEISISSEEENNLESEENNNKKRAKKRKFSKICDKLLEIEYTKLKILKLETKQNQGRKKLNEENTDDDRSFFESIIPHVKELTTDQRMKFRLDVQKLLIDYRSSNK